MQVGLVVIIMLSLLASSQAKMICSSNTNLEPTLYDIILPFVSSLLPDESRVDLSSHSEKNEFDIEDRVEDTPSEDALADDTVEPIHADSDSNTGTDNVKQFNKYVEQATIHISKALNREVPFVSFISYGRYDIELSNTDDLWNKITLIQKQHFVVSVICSNDLLQPYLQSWCQCENDLLSITKGVTDDDYMFKNASDYIQQHNPGKWCINKKGKCTSKDFINGKCTITEIDPFLSSCLWIPTEKAEVLVSYTLDTPMVSSHYNITSILLNIASMAGDVVEGDSSLPDAVTRSVPVLRKYASMVGPYLDSWAAYVPYCLANLITGFIILYYSESLTSSSLFRYSIAGLFGLLIAFMMFAIYIYRTLENIIKQSVPSFVHFLLVPLTAVFSTYIYSYSLQKHFFVTAFDLSIKFWKNGGNFGYDWLGKAFFLSSAVLSMIFTKYFNFLKEKTLSYNALYYLVIGLGSYFVLKGSSSFTVAFSLLLLILYWEELSQWFYVWYVNISGSQQKTHVQRISKEVFLLLTP